MISLIFLGPFTSWVAKKPHLHFGGGETSTPLSHILYSSNHWVPRMGPAHTHKKNNHCPQQQKIGMTPPPVVVFLLSFFLFVWCFCVSNHYNEPITFHLLQKTKRSLHWIQSGWTNPSDKYAQVKLGSPSSRIRGDHSKNPLKFHPGFIWSPRHHQVGSPRFSKLLKLPVDVWVVTIASLIQPLMLQIPSAIWGA